LITGIDPILLSVIATKYLRMQIRRKQSNHTQDKYATRQTLISFTMFGLDCFVPRNDGKKE
jgi:hypothetical protein